MHLNSIIMSLQIKHSPIADCNKSNGIVLLLVKVGKYGTRIYKDARPGAANLEVIKKKMDKTKTYQIYPSQSDWGKYGFTFPSLELALLKFDEIEMDQQSIFDHKEPIRLRL